MDQALIQAAKEVGGSNQSLIVFGAFAIVALCYAIITIWNSYHEIVKEELKDD